LTEGLLALAALAFAVADLSLDVDPASAAIALSLVAAVDVYAPFTCEAAERHKQRGYGRGDLSSQHCRSFLVAFRKSCPVRGDPCPSG